MPNLRILFNQGVNTSKLPEELSNGELVSGIGAYYPPGLTTGIAKIPGRTEFGDTGTGMEVLGPVYAEYDPGGTDRLLVYSSGTIWSATPGDTGTFVELSGGFSQSPVDFGGVHWQDRWYLYNGVDRNVVVENDGTVIYHGMFSPQEAPALTSGTEVGTQYLPSGFSNADWANTDNINDNPNTFAGGTLTGPGTTTLLISGFGDGTGTARKLLFRWSLAGVQILDPDNESSWGGGGGDYTSDFLVRTTMAISTDGGNSFTAVFNQNRTSFTPSIFLSRTIDDSVDLADFVVKAELQYTQGVNPATYRIYNAVIKDAAVAGPLTTSDAIQYAISEYDEDRGWESPIGPATPATSFSGVYSVTVPMPTQRNTNSTHFRVYRLPEGGSLPDDLGLVAQVPVTEDSFVDTFELDTTSQTRPLTPMVEVVERDETIRVPRDSPPPAFKHMNLFKGSLVGVSAVDPRELRYSVPGSLISFPEIYVIRGFPFQKRDELIATATVGDTLLIAASRSMVYTTILPLSIEGRFEAANIVPLAGQPGCVGPDAITAYSVAGEAHAAWVSPQGIHITNIATSRRITTDLDWDSIVNQATLNTSKLFFDEDLDVLFFFYDSDADGVNDRFMVVHLDQVKENGLPRITYGHYATTRGFAAGYVSNVFKRWSAHASDGKVYLDWNGTTDASNSYDGNGTVPMILKSARIYGDWNYLEAIKASIRTNGFGSSQSATWTWEAGVDSPENIQTVTGSVSLVRGDEFFIGRNGEWHQVTLQHTGSSDGKVNDVRATILVHGEAGELS